MLLMLKLTCVFVTQILLISSKFKFKIPIYFLQYRLFKKTINEMVNHSLNILSLALKIFLILMNYVKNSKVYNYKSFIICIFPNRNYFQS